MSNPRRGPAQAAELPQLGAAQLAPLIVSLIDTPPLNCHSTEWCVWVTTPLVNHVSACVGVSTPLVNHELSKRLHRFRWGGWLQNDVSIKPYIARRQGT